MPGVHTYIAEASSQLEDCCREAWQTRVRFRMQDYLPPKVQEAFIATLTEFVLLPWREAMRSTLDGASQGGSQVRELSNPMTHPVSSAWIRGCSLSQCCMLPR